MRRQSAAPYKGGMTKSQQLPAEANTPPTMKWSVGGLLLEALAERNFAHMSEGFDPAATMRALLPNGPAEFQGAAKIAENFQSWFGDAEAFEVLDGTVGEVGNRLHLAWRLRLAADPLVDFAHRHAQHARELLASAEELRRAQQRAAINRRSHARMIPQVRGAHNRRRPDSLRSGAPDRKRLTV